jgi:hypothetical protein
MEKCYKFEAAKKLAKTPNPHAKGKDQKKPGAHRAPTNLPIKPTAFFSYRPDDQDDPPPCTKLSYCRPIRTHTVRSGLFPYTVLFRFRFTSYVTLCFRTTSTLTSLVVLQLRRSRCSREIVVTYHIH